MASRFVAPRTLASILLLLQSLTPLCAGWRLSKGALDYYLSSIESAALDDLGDEAGSELDMARAAQALAAGGAAAVVVGGGAGAAGGQKSRALRWTTRPRSTMRS